MYAVRDIKKGEELTLPYIDIMQPFAYRKEALAGLGFKCSCRSCQNPTSSDALRQSVINCLVPTLPSMSIFENLIMAMRYSHKVIKAMEQEGLESSSSYLEYLSVARQAHIELGDMANAIEYGRKLGKLVMMASGDPDAVERFLDPRVHSDSSF